jgi:hypothetical protein
MNTKLYTLILLTLLSQIGCDDIIEVDISNKAISTISPSDKSTSDQSTQIFWWNTIENAEFYRLQLVKGTFISIQQFIVDTAVVGDKFRISLNPGNYTWRIRGENNGYQTRYSYYSFTIDSTLDLTNQQLLMLFPLDNFISNSVQLNFTWNLLSSASNYHLKIYEQPSNNLLTDTLTTLNSYVKIFQNEGNYIWQVRAENNIGFTQYNSRNFMVDITPPTPPLIIAPSVGSFVSINDSLKWNSASDAFLDSLYIYADSLQQIIQIKVRSNSPYIITNILSTGNHFWNVISFDIAGNRSTASSIFKFYLQ